MQNRIQRGFKRFEEMQILNHSCCFCEGDNLSIYYHSSVYLMGHFSVFPLLMSKY